MRVYRPPTIGYSDSKKQMGNQDAWPFSSPWPPVSVEMTRTPGVNDLYPLRLMIRGSLHERNVFWKIPEIDSVVSASHRDG